MEPLRIFLKHSWMKQRGWQEPQGNRDQRLIEFVAGLDPLIASVEVGATALPAAVVVYDLPTGFILNFANAADAVAFKLKWIDDITFLDAAV